MTAINPEKTMPNTAFAALGMPEIAYVKRLGPAPDAGYAIHAANGKKLATVATRDAAFATVLQNDLMPVSVH